VAPLPNRESVAAAWLDVLQARNSDAPTSPASIDRAAFAADAEVGRRVLRANCKSGADAKCLFLNIASLFQAALAATPRGLASEMAFVLFSCFGTVLQDEPAPLHAALALLDYAQVCFGPSPYELVQFSAHKRDTVHFCAPRQLLRWHTTVVTGHLRLFSDNAGRRKVLRT